jgi:hypothetical protein
MGDKLHPSDPTHTRAALFIGAGLGLFMIATSGAILLLWGFRLAAESAGGGLLVWWRRKRKAHCELTSAEHSA